MINISNLHKVFGQRSAVKDLSFSVATGEAFGLLGPNGAGKTTTIRILTMLSQPTSGDISIGGFKLAEHPLSIKQLIGVVPQHFNLDGDLTAIENLILHAKLHHLSSAEYMPQIENLLEFTELSDRRNDFVGKFSGGMKRRLMIARALLHNPKVLFLDEPTVGLDPQVRRNIWLLIRRMKADGMTILLTTHYIEEAESLCDRVAIMEKGQLLVLDTPTALKEGIGSFVVEWTLDNVLQSKFFATRSEASSFAATICGNTVIRDCNLEDVFVELTGRKVSV